MRSGLTLLGRQQKPERTLHATSTCAGLAWYLAAISPTSSLRSSGLPPCGHSYGPVPLAGKLPASRREGAEVGARQSVPGPAGGGGPRAKRRRCTPRARVAVCGAQGAVRHQGDAVLLAEGDQLGLR